MLPTALAPVSCGFLSLVCSFPGGPEPGFAPVSATNAQTPGEHSRSQAPASSVLSCAECWLRLDPSSSPGYFLCVLSLQGDISQKDCPPRVCPLGLAFLFSTHLCQSLLDTVTCVPTTSSQAQPQPLPLGCPEASGFLLPSGSTPLKELPLQRAGGPSVVCAGL